MYCGLAAVMLTRPTTTAHTDAAPSRIRLIALSLNVLGGLPRGPRREPITRGSRDHGIDARETRTGARGIPWGIRAPPAPGESHQTDASSMMPPDLALPSGGSELAPILPGASVPREYTSAEDQGGCDGSGRAARAAPLGRPRARSCPRRTRAVSRRRHPRDPDATRGWPGADHVGSGRLRRPPHARRDDVGTPPCARGRGRRHPHRSIADPLAASRPPFREAPARVAGADARGHRGRGAPRTLRRAERRPQRGDPAHVDDLVGRCDLHLRPGGARVVSRLSLRRSERVDLASAGPLPPAPTHLPEHMVGDRDLRGADVDGRAVWRGAFAPRYGRADPDARRRGRRHWCPVRTSQLLLVPLSHQWCHRTLLDDGAAGAKGARRYPVPHPC